MSVTTMINSLPSSTDALTAEQLRFVHRLIDHDRTFGILQAGFGKTITSLCAMKYRLDNQSVGRWLVVAPLRPARNWCKEWEAWGFPCDWVAEAIGTPKQRTAAFESDAPIVVTNIDNIVWASKEGLLKGFDGLVIDEISKFKGVGGKAFKVMRRVVKQFTVRIGLSATPAAEGAEGLYGQCMLLDDGERFGTSKEKFLHRFFFPTDFEERNWELRDGALEDLVARMGDLLYADDGEYNGSGLPTLVFEPLYVVFPLAGESLAARLSEEGVVQVQPYEKELLFEDVVAHNGGVLVQKQLQIASGFVYTDAGTPFPIHSAKLDAMRDMIHQMVEDGENVAVAYSYQWEYDKVKEIYPDAVDVREPGAEERWQRGEIPVLLIHPKSGGHGLNLQKGGHTLLVWTLPWSLDLWDQLIRRFLRRGQESKFVSVIPIIAASSRDLSVLSKLEDKYRKQDEFNVVVQEVING